MDAGGESLGAQNEGREPLKRQRSPQIEETTVNGSKLEFGMLGVGDCATHNQQPMRVTAQAAVTECQGTD